MKEVVYIEVVREMITCKICGKKVKNVAGLISHLRTHDITYDEYKKLIQVKKERCKICGKEFDNIANHVVAHGFRDYNQYLAFCRMHKHEIVMLNRYRNRPAGKVYILKLEKVYGIRVTP